MFVEHEADVFLDAQAVEQGARLEDQADLELVRGVVVGEQALARSAFDQDLAGVRLEQAGSETEGGGLARARRADDAHRLARVDAEGAAWY